MKKRVLSLALALAMVLSLGGTAAAVYLYDYDSYQEGYDQGTADAEAGKASQMAEEKLDEIARQYSYADGYTAGYELATLKKSPDYQRGYQDGYEAGYQDGLNGDWGCDQSYDDSEESENYIQGYDNGYSDGYDDATDEKWGEGDPLPEAFGWTEGRLNVMINGRCVSFGKVWPERKGGRIMVPVRKILEALGARVTYDDGVVNAERDGVILRHTVGTKVIQRWPDGDTEREPETLVMDRASYSAHGRTFVPARFVSEAFGYSVYWDADYETVVILDEAAFRAAHDGDFTVMNLLRSSVIDRVQAGKTTHDTVKMALDMTLLDSLNGDKRFRGSLDLDGLVNEAGARCQVQWDLRELLSLLLEYEAAPLESDEAKRMEKLVQSSLELRADREAGRAYFRTPLLEELVGTEASWLEMPFEWPESTAAATMADAALKKACESADWPSPIFYWQTAEETLEEFKSVLGDENFTKSGSTYVFQTGRLMETLKERIDEELSWGPEDYGDGNADKSSLDMEFRVTDHGDGTCSYTGQMHFRSDGAALSLSLRGDDGGGHLTVSQHLRNRARADLTVDCTARLTDEAVQTTPPPSEEVENWDDRYLSNY